MAIFSLTDGAAVTMAMIVCISIAPGVRRYEVIKPSIPMIKLQPAKAVEKPEPEKNYEDVTLTCSFYTSLEICNGVGNANVNALGGQLETGQIAAPYSIPFHTKFVTEEFGEFTVADRGNPNYIKELADKHYKVDVYIARNDGESDSDYHTRVLHMGLKTITAKMYKE